VSQCTYDSFGGDGKSLTAEMITEGKMASSASLPFGWKSYGERIHGGLSNRMRPQDDGSLLRGVRLQVTVNKVS